MDYKKPNKAKRAKRLKAVVQLDRTLDCGSGDTGPSPVRLTCSPFDSTIPYMVYSALAGRAIVCEGNIGFDHLIATSIAARQKGPEA